MIEIQSFEEVPEFANEDEEAEFWATHSLGEAILAQMQPIGEDELPPARPRTRPIAVNLEEEVVRRLNALARAKGKDYHTLLKEFIVERLVEEEKRAGLVGRRSDG